MCLQAGRSAGISLCLSSTGHIVASKLSVCLHPCYFSWKTSPLVLHCCTGQLCCLKTLRTESHLRSDSTNLHTHLRVLLLAQNFERRICLCKAWMQEAVIPIIWSCVLWDFSVLESARRVPCDPAGLKARYKRSSGIYFCSG